VAENNTLGGKLRNPRRVVGLDCNWFINVHGRRFAVQPASCR
jgi:hypothetical protein